MKSFFRNLGEFVRFLDEQGELKTVRDKVSPIIEISRYTDAESKAPGGGKALLFTNVEGSEFPVATNIFGSKRRICMALGVSSLDELGRRVKELIDTAPPAGLRDILQLIPTALDISRFFPRKHRGAAPCQEVVIKGADVDLGKIPVLKCWPKDAGRFFTLPLVVTRSLSSGKRNMGMYRMQVFDRDSTGMHWHIHKDGSNYFNEYRKAGKRMPVSVAVGCDPATTYAATAPMPRNVDELILAGFIRRKPVTTVKCVTNDLEVPAEAEFVLEGYVEPDELRLEGPFGDHTGYYSLADDYPVFHVTAITHRKNPIYSATLVGKPPMEDCYLAKATERLFLPVLQTAFPEIKEYFFPWEGVFHNIVIVAIDKEYPRHAHKVMAGLWGQGQMSFCKAIVVVDDTVDPSDLDRVLGLILTVFDPETDLVNTEGVLDVLDHSSPHAVYGNKLGIDLTARLAGEPPRRTGPDLPGPEMSADQVSAACKDRLPWFSEARVIKPGELGQDQGAGRERMLIMSVAKDRGRSGREIVDQVRSISELRAFPIILIYDADVDLGDNSTLLWKLFNNTDPGRDIYREDGRLMVDACRKGPADGHNREWPDELSFDVE